MLMSATSGEAQFEVEVVLDYTWHLFFQKFIPLLILFSSLYIERLVQSLRKKMTNQNCLTYKMDSDYNYPTYLMIPEMLNNYSR